MQKIMRPTLVLMEKWVKFGDIWSSEDEASRLLDYPGGVVVTQCVRGGEISKLLDDGCKDGVRRGTMKRGLPVPQRSKCHCGLSGSRLPLPSGRMHLGSSPKKKTPNR
jgi:hypothetical protein